MFLRDLKKQRDNSESFFKKMSSNEASMFPKEYCRQKSSFVFEVFFFCTIFLSAFFAFENSRLPFGNGAMLLCGPKTNERRRIFVCHRQASRMDQNWPNFVIGIIFLIKICRRGTHPFQCLQSSLQFSFFRILKLLTS